MATKYAFSSAVKELRFALCQSSDASAATRKFLLRAYPTMKKHNPETPIMIREALNVEPKVYARYELGREKMVPLKGLDDASIESKITDLVKSS
ncbi:thioredoxin-like protein [Phyllosticta capitalensis]|uniref:Thioredoxin-like protein n=1 Tax=Phyllosticta capitalensis TaxID=121624 RepID=A0ABR1YWI9_9PEZI